MKIVSFEFEGNRSFGCLTPRGIVDVGRHKGQTNVSVRAFLDDWQDLSRFETLPADYALTDVLLLPPIPDAQRVLCVGLNYKSHIAETGREPPKFPMLFNRYWDTLVGPNEPILRPRISETFDFEGELAFVIGRGGRNIPKAEALGHVAGYTCFNDGSVREFQFHTVQWLPGKNFWRSGSFGPYLVTPDEVGELDDINLITRLNGEVVQQARLDDLLFGVADLVSYISTFIPLNPGDVVATGTTGGVGAFRKPPLWMKPGDRVEVEIDRVGLLVNEVEDDPS